MALLEIRSSIKLLNLPDPRRDACVREAPECVRFAADGSAAAGSEPPVRIYLGTEPGQYRAERIFVYSVEKHRAPSRTYEVHLMKDLAGFDRRGWTTGFTNYRFAVPHLAGGAGRAIFNDVDEAYFGDPAELFDAEMNGHGYLATSDTETSVMLIDCARMAPIWPLRSCQHDLKKQLLARTLRLHADIRGDLPRAWTARDQDFIPGSSKLQHWTTLHTQPWRPVPGRFVYQPNPTGSLWFALEREADAAGFQVFDASHPSSLFRRLRERLRAASRARRGNALERSSTQAHLDDVIRHSGARTLLDYALARSATDAVFPRPDLDLQPRVSHFDLAAPRKRRPCDGVVCEGVLELLPDEDAPWVVDDLFARARRFVFAVVANQARDERLTDGSKLAVSPRDPSRWHELFEAAGRRHPQLYWILIVAEDAGLGRTSLQVRDGGRRLPVRDGSRRGGTAPPPRGLDTGVRRSEGTPVVWLLADPREEIAAQALALADALGWPYERLDLDFGRLGEIDARLLGASTIALDRRSAALLSPPWPDVVVSAGAHCAAAARWIRDRDRGRTRLVHVGREAGEEADLFDAIVTPSFAGLWPHPKRIETTALLTRAPAKRLVRSRSPESNPFGDAPLPHIALLLDVPRGAELPGDAVRRMGAQVHRFAAQAGGSLRAAVGSRVGERLRSALAEGIGDPRALAGDESISRLLDAADAVVVAGNDAALVSEAAGSARTLYIHPLADRRFQPALPLREWVTQRASERPVNARGTARPQQGLEYLAARLIERGVVLPPSDPTELHQQLYARGAARPFGAPLALGETRVLDEASEIAGRVRDLLGYPPAAESAG